MTVRGGVIVGSLAMLLGVAPAGAQQKTFTIGAYGGSFEQVMRKDVIPAFEAKHGVKVEYVAGNSTDTLAKLQAQKGNQVIDAIIVDDGPMYQAVELGFCATLEPGDVYKDVYSIMKFKSNQAIGIGVVGTGLMYNKKVFDEKGWPAPTSWKDLADKKYGKTVIVPAMNNTYGLHAVVMSARIRGGSEANMDAGFKAFKDEIGPNVLAYESSPGKMTELFQSGQALLAVWGSGRAKSLSDTGFPSAFVYPKRRRRCPRHCRLPGRWRQERQGSTGLHPAPAVAGNTGDPGHRRRLWSDQQYCQAGAGAAEGPALRRSGEGPASDRLGYRQQEPRRLEQALDPRDRALTEP